MQTTAEWKILGCTVKFLTPAFLGDANQQGRWRTPPFKALLRQWWRVAYAAKRNFTVDVLEMREKEGQLFGNAWLTKKEHGREKTAASRSQVRLRLEHWRPGTLSTWGGLEPTGVTHPEVGRSSIGPQLYLGYGPLSFAHGATTLQRAPAIAPTEQARLSVAVPESEAALIEQALYLMHLYGTAGGRSRNGWGSFALEPAPAEAPVPQRPWRYALEVDWAHALGRDERGPLIWQTVPGHEDWKEAMRALALIRLAVRTLFPFSNPPTRGPEERHWLAYPVTNHNQPWGPQLRLPNSLRFKVRLREQDSSKLAATVFHVPCLPPPDFKPYRTQIGQVWERVHRLLDELSKPDKQRSYQHFVKDKTWLAKVAPQLASLRLERVER